jgi:Cu-Zn family superoxide dismutase
VNSKLVTAAVVMALSASAIAAEAATKAAADLKDASGRDAGSVTLSQGLKGVLLHVTVKGLTPGWHAIHFHEVGDCSAPDFKTAGGHVHAQATRVHGLLNPDANEAGDLPNLFVAGDGTGAAEFFSTSVSLDGAEGQPALLDKDGSAMVIHANPDDFVSQPIGGAGARIACGVIR